MSATKLKHYDKFKQALTGYQLSERAKKALEDLNLVLLVAPTSTGRNTLIGELLKSGEYYFIVSDTTRPPQVRDGKLEKDGDQYYFRSEEEVLADIQAGDFLEAALIHEQQVSGISIRELKKAKKSNKIAITDIEVIGASNVVKAKPDAKIIFVVPPSFDEWQRRIRSRSQMSDAEFKNRLQSADKELMAALDHDYYQFVIATDIAHTTKEVDLIAKGHPDTAENQKGRALVKQIHEQLIKQLNQL